MQFVFYSGLNANKGDSTNVIYIFLNIPLSASNSNYTKGIKPIKEAFINRPYTYSFLNIYVFRLLR